MSEEIASGSEEAEAKPRVRLSPEEWAEIRHLAETGQEKSSALAKRFSISPQAVHDHFTRNKITWGSKKAEWDKKVAATAAAASAAAAGAAVAASPVLAGFASKKKERIEKTREDVYAGAVALHALTMKIAAEHARGGASPGEKLDDIKGLEKMAKVLQTTFEVRSKVLDLENDVDEEALPELKIRDLTRADLEKIHGGEDEDDEEIEMPDLSGITAPDDDVVETA